MAGRGWGRGRGRGDASQGHGGPHRPQAHGPSTRGQGAAPHGTQSRLHTAPAQTRLEAQMQQMNLGSGTSGSGQGNGAAPIHVAGDAAGPSQHVEQGRAGPSRSVAEAAAGPVGRGSMRGRRVIDYQFLETRPKDLATKQGTNGHRSELVANYFKIKTLADWALQQYRVDIAPEEDRTFERRNLVKVHRETFGWYIFDGTVLYTSTRLSVSLGESITLTSQSETGTIYTITVRHVNEVHYGDYAYQQVFNLLMRTCIRALGLQLVGRDFYDPDPRVKILIREYGLELWPGYKTSIRQHEAGILMCVEITHKIMRMDTVLDMLRECHRDRGPEYYQKAFSDEIIGCVVLTRYNNKTYQITDVDFNRTPQSTFQYRDTEISIAQYMREKYQIEIRDLKQPLLISRARARDVRAGMTEIINLIPEVCHCTGLTDRMRADWRVMKAVTQYTRIQPAERINRLLAFNQRLQSNQQAMAELGRFNMTLDNQLTKIPGRLLDPEKIYFLNDAEVKAETFDWTHDVKKFHLLRPLGLTRWVVIYSTKDRDKFIGQNVRKFIDLLQKAGRGMGIVVQPPQIEELPQDHLGAYVQHLNQVMDRCQPELIMIVVSNINAAKYSAIKKKCLVDRSVPSQVMLSKNLNDPKRSMSIASKMMIQMSCKLGGAPWRVAIPPQGLMVVGFDVCHDTHNKASSYGALVASLDRHCTKYFSTVTPHNNGEELSHNLGLNVIKAVRKYQENNNALPDKIFIYRDGVGEGQLPYVIETELRITKEKLASTYPKDQPPKLTFIIVTKRINTRLFMNHQNPQPGTIADDVITDPEKYDFFLISQSVRDGTVSPTSYNVLLDENRYKPGQIQLLTFKLCHLYYNWSGTVKVPAPCQYAHKLAFLVGNFLHKEPAAGMNDKLYFL